MERRAAWILLFCCLVALYLVVQPGTESETKISAKPIVTSSKTGGTRLKFKRPKKPRPPAATAVDKADVDYIYCVLQELGLNFPLTEQSVIYGWNHPELFPDGTTGNEVIGALVDDPQCPLDKYSYVHIVKNDFGRWEERKLLSCQSASLGELYLSTGRTKELLEPEMTGEEFYSYAIMGEGMFVTECVYGTVLSRFGTFFQTDHLNVSEGLLVDGWDCRLLNTRMEPIFAREGDVLESVGHKWCFQKSGECMAVVDDYNQFEVREMLGSHRIRVHLLGRDLKTESHIVLEPNQVENLSTDPGELETFSGIYINDFEKPNTKACHKLTARL